MSAFEVPLFANVFDNFWLHLSGKTWTGFWIHHYAGQCAQFIAAVVMFWLFASTLEVLADGKATLFRDGFKLLTYPVRALVRSAWWKVFLLRWRHRREERLIASMRLLPDEEEALRARAAAHMIEEAEKILRSPPRTTGGSRRG